jgi:cytochrome c-type biogenesis protein CcmH/NrfG
MNYPKRIALLLILLISNVSSTMAAIAQNKKPNSEFIDRAAPPVSPETKKEMEARLNEARRQLKAKPNDPGARIWVGRRLGYLGRVNVSNLV